MKCIHCHPDPDNFKQCEILLATLLYDIDDPRYPKEWIHDENDDGICTAHVTWDWDNDGDPDDPDNPKAPQPEDPNQLCLPFIFDELEIKPHKYLHDKTP